MSEDKTGGPAKHQPTTRGPWLKDPRQPRKGETIGGGYFVFRRGERTNRIRPSQWPFEYDNEADALQQAAILAAQHPGYVFQVLSVVNAAMALPEDVTVEAHRNKDRTDV